MENEIKQLTLRISGIAGKYQDAAAAMRPGAPARNGSTVSASEDIRRLKTEMESYKKIIGNYHVTKESKTYRDLMDENRNLQSEVKTGKYTISRLEKENSQLKKDKETSEQETIMLRQLRFPHEQPEAKRNKNRGDKAGSRKACEGKYMAKKGKPAKDRTKKQGLFHRGKKENPDPVSPLSDSEKKERLREHLVNYNRYYTDLQIIFLAKVLDHGLLPADEMARLFNPLMSAGRMEQFFSILCARHHIPEHPGQDEGGGDSSGQDEHRGDSSGQDNVGKPAENGSASAGDDTGSKPPVILIDPEPDQARARETAARFAQAFYARTGTGKVRR